MTAPTASAPVLAARAERGVLDPPALDPSAVGPAPDPDGPDPDGPDPDAVASALLACPHVVGLRAAAASGGAADVATYLPGRRVDGVRVDGSTVTVRIVCWFGPTVSALADEVRDAVVSVAPAVGSVDVIVEDLLIGGSDEATTTATGPDELDVTTER